jgi:hypothetical protein
VIRQLWHFIRGHHWIEERWVMVPTAPVFYGERMGITVILWTCECTAIKRMEVAGQFPSVGNEIRELKRIAKL